MTADEIRTQSLDDDDDERKFSWVGAQACKHESDETWGFKYQDEAGQLFQALDRTYQLGRYVETGCGARASMPLRRGLQGAFRNVWRGMRPEL